jgi:hypothetical protein
MHKCLQTCYKPAQTSTNMLQPGTTASMHHYKPLQAVTNTIGRYFFTTACWLFVYFFTTARIFCSLAVCAEEGACCGLGLGLGLWTAGGEVAAYIT